MKKEERKSKWKELLDAASDEIVEWRVANKRANFGEIERKVDENLAVVRKQILEDMLLASESADIKVIEKEKRPKCKKCGVSLRSEGKRKRSLTTDHEQVVELTRSYASCSECGESFFPPR